MTSRALRFTAAAALAAAALLRPSSATAEIRWETRLERASQAALSSNRPIFMEFWAVWCAPCKEMEAKVYSTPAVSEAMRRVTPLRIDMDRQQDVARKYAVDAMPTIIVADSYGNELMRHTGALTLETMLQLLSALPRDVTAINRYAAVLASEKDDYPALLALASELQSGGFLLAGNRALERALKTSEAKQDPDRRARILLDIGRNYLALDAQELARATLKKVISGYPGTPAAKEAARLLEGRARDGGR